MRRVLFLVLATLFAACGHEARPPSRADHATATATPLTSAALKPTRAAASPRAPTPTPIAWTRVDEGKFSFEIPTDMRKEDVQGIDSLVGRYNSETLFLAYDYGFYGSDCTKEQGDEAERRGQETTIDGNEARMIFLAWTDPSIEQSHWACVFFPKVASQSDSSMPTTLVVSISGEDGDAWTVGRRIFESVLFER